jgi:hypothetical protein
MRNLLKAMGFWIWGLIAIGVSVSLVTVSYRMLSIYRAHDQAASPISSTTGSSVVSDARALPPISEPRRASVNDSRQSAVAAVAIRPEALNHAETAEGGVPVVAPRSKPVQESAGYSNIDLDKFRTRLAAYEEALSRGAYKEEELVRVFRMLFQLAAVSQQPAKAIGYGQKVHDAGSMRSNDLLIMSQLYYQQKDCKNAALWGDESIAAYKNAGESPKEVLYQIKLQCAADANETAAEISALYDLVRLTNKANYWNNLIRLERQDERDDHNLLMLYRVMYDTDSIQADTDYIEMAQLLGDAGLPGEAQRVLEKAMSSGLVKEDHKERIARLVNSMRSRADSDKKELAALDAEADKSTAGQLDIKVGEMFFGAGDYEDASVAITRGLGKGQIKQPDEAIVYLGRDWVAQHDQREAQKAFAQLKAVPNISPRVLRLWNLYADTIQPGAPVASL